MSFPFFPTLTPPIASSLWFDVVSQDDETEINQIENEHQNFLNLIQNIASDLHPIGKLPDQNIADQESDDEANDESEDTDNSHDNSDEDEEIDDRNNGRESN